MKDLVGLKSPLCRELIAWIKELDAFERGDSQFGSDRDFERQADTRLKQIIPLLSMTEIRDICSEIPNNHIRLFHRVTQDQQQATEIEKHLFLKA